MNYRQLGSTGLSVTEIGLGTWEIGADWGTVSEKEGQEAVATAIDAGVNFLDTADVYGDGRSEQLIRRVLGQEDVDNEDIVVEEGEVYLHGQSGERKATGTYYTKTQFVEHLLDNSLDPALDDHIERIDRLRETEGENAAAEAFFDIRVSDIAMGSGHFLVGAVDRIEARLRSYLTENNLTPVEEELDNLRDAAEDAFVDEEYTPNIEQGQLLRRQVARRCVYGVDLNPLATELARLSIWVHTFVPGLPLTFLDYNLGTCLTRGRNSGHSLSS